MPTGEQYNLIFSILAQDETASGVNSATAGLQKVKAGAGEAATATESMGARMRNAFSSVSSATETLKSAFTAITTAAATLSVGLAAISAAGAETNNTLDQTAISLGVTNSALKDMVQSSTSATAGITGFTRTVDYLSRTGDYSLDTLKSMTQEFGALGKAIKSSFNPDTTGDVMAKDLTPMFDIWDKDLEQIKDYSDRFTDAFTQHRLTPGTLATDVQKEGQAYEDAGFSMEEFLGIEEALSDAGVTGRTRVKDLKDAIASADTQMKAYTDSVKANADAHTKLANDLQTAQDKYASIGDQLASAQKQIKGYNDAIAETQQNISDLTEKYNEAVNDTSDYASAYKSLTSAAEGYQNSIANEQATLDNLTAAMATNQKEYEKLTSEYATAEKTVSDLSAQYQASLTNMDFFAAAQATCKDKVKQLSDQIQSAGESVLSYSDKVNDLAEKHIDLEKSLASAQETLAETEKTYQDTLDSTETLDKATQEHTETIQKLKDDYEKTGDSIEKYTDDLVKLEYQQNKDKQGLVSAQEDVASLQAQYDELTNAKNSSGGALYVDPTSMSELADKLQAAKDKVADYNFNIAESAKEHSRLEETISEANTTQNDQAAALQKAQSDQTWYTDALEKTAEAQKQASDAVESAAKKVQDLTKEISQNEKDTASAEQALSKAQTTVNTLAGDLGTAQQNLADFGSATIDGTKALTPYQKAAKDTADAQAALADKLQSAKDNAANLKDQMSKNRDDLAKDQTEYGKVTQAIAGYAQQLEAANAQIAEFHAHGKDTFTDEKSPYATADAAHDEKVKAAQDAITAANKTLSKQQDDLSEANANISKLQGQQDDAASQIVNLQAQIVKNQQDGINLAASQPDEKNLVVRALAGETGGGVNQSAINADVAAGGNVTPGNRTQDRVDAANANMPFTTKIGNLWDKFATWAAPYANSPIGQGIQLIGGYKLGSWGLSKLGGLKGLFGKGAAGAGEAAGGLTTGGILGGSGATGAAGAASEITAPIAEDLGYGFGNAGSFASQFGESAAADIATGTNYAEWGLGMAPGDAGAAAALGEGATVSVPEAAAAGTSISSLVLPLTALTGSVLAAGAGLNYASASGAQNQPGVLSGLAAITPYIQTLSNPTIGVPALLGSAAMNSLGALFGGKKATVETEVKPPTGDKTGIDILGAWGKVNPVAASAGEITPIDWNGEVKPTVTGGENVTKTTKGEIKRGTDAVPKSGPFDWLTSIFGTANDPDSTVSGTTTQTVTDALDQTPKDNSDSPFGWLTSILGSADDGGSILSSGQDTIDTGTGAIPSDNLLNPLSWLSSILGTADDADSILNSGQSTISAGTGAIPRSNLGNPLGWLSSILGSANDNDSIFSTGNSTISAGVGRIPKQQSFGNASTIIGSIANPTWYTTVESTLQGALDTLHNWFIGAMNTALSIPSSVVSFAQNAISNVSSTVGSVAQSAANTLTGGNTSKPVLPLPATFGQPGTAWHHVADNSAAGYHWENSGSSGSSNSTGQMTYTNLPAGESISGPSGSSWTGAVAIKYHSGGIFEPEGGGNEGLAFLERGEAVLTQKQQAGVNSLVNEPGNGSDSMIASLTAQMGSLIQTVQALASAVAAGGSSLTVNLQGAVIREEQDIQKLAAQIASLERKQGYAAGYR